MKLTLKKSDKPSTPWNVTMAKLTRLEAAIRKAEHQPLMDRWHFGSELARHRVEYKGRQIVPRDLMDLARTECGLSEAEITKRVQFAVRYPTKELMRNAVTSYTSWHQMVKEGLVEKKADKKSAKTTKGKSTSKRVIPRLRKELEQAFAESITLTRDEVRDLDELLALVQRILAKVDQHDAERAS